MDPAEEEAATPPGGSPVPSTSRRGRGKQADQLPEVDEELSSGRQRSRQSRTRGASENESEAKPSRASSKPVEVKAEVSKGRSKRGQKLEALNASAVAAEPDKPTVEKRSKDPVPKVEEEPKVEVAAPAASVGRRGRASASALKAAAVVEPVSSTAVTASSPAPRRGRVSARQAVDRPAAEDKPQPGRGRKASASSLKEEATPVSGEKARGSSGPLEAAAPAPGRKGKRSVEAEIEEEEEDTPIAAKRGRTSKSIPVAKETQTPAAKPSSPAKPSRQRGSRSRTNEVEEQPTPETEPLAEVSKGRGRRSAKSSEASQNSAPTKKSAAAADASASKSVNARRKHNLSIVDETKGDETSPEKKSKVEAPPKPSRGRGKKSVAAVDEEAADADNDNDVSVASTTSSGPRGRRGSTKDVAKVEELGSSRRSRASEKTRGVADKTVNDVKKVTLESAVLRKMI